MNKVKRFEVRISEEEKKFLEQIKDSTGKNISEIFRDFIYSYNLENNIKAKKNTLRQLEREKETIIQDLYTVYSELRNSYLPYRLVIDFIKHNKEYFKRDKNSVRYEDYLKFEKFITLVNDEERIKKLDETRVKRDCLRAKLKTVENQLHKNNLY